METIAIVAENDNHGGYRLINKSDFNPEIHELFSAEKPVQIALKDKPVKQTKQAGE